MSAYSLAEYLRDPRVALVDGKRCEVDLGTETLVFARGRSHPFAPWSATDADGVEVPWLGGRYLPELLEKLLGPPKGTG